MRPEEMIGKTIKLGFHGNVRCSKLVVCSYCSERTFICSILEDEFWHGNALVKIIIIEALKNDSNHKYLEWTWKPINL